MKPHVARGIEPPDADLLRRKGQQSFSGRPRAAIRGPYGIPLAVFALASASALCIGLLTYRIHRTDNPFYWFLAWNLFLAWVPLAFSVAAFHRAVRAFDLWVGAFLVLWLLFFPNAPYVLTDFIHLHEGRSVPLWYDALMLSAFAWTALMLGFVSLYLVQTVVRRAVGVMQSWIVVTCALALASFGVYLGRYLRFNSWDAMVRPRRLASVIRNELDNPLAHPRMIAALLALTAFLFVGYAVVYGFAAMRLEFEQRD